MANSNAGHTASVDVLQKSVNGIVSESASYSDLNALHYQEEAKEQSGPLSEIFTEVLDVFMFEQTAEQPLPTITEEHVIEYNSIRHDVIRVISIHFRRPRLIVKTRRPR